MDANFNSGLKLLRKIFYEQLISALQKSLQNDSENYATINNIGFVILELAILEKKIEMIKIAIFYFKRAGFLFRIINEHTLEYDIAHGNLIQANTLLKDENFLKTKV